MQPRRMARVLQAFQICLSIKIIIERNEFVLDRFAFKALLLMSVYDTGHRKRAGVTK